MDIFTEVYEKSSQMVKSRCFEERWSNIEPKLRSLLAAGGPNANEADVLELIRSKLQEAAKGEAKPAEAIANEILSLSRTKIPGFQERAALIKLLQHFYFLAVKGNQSIWVVDHPVDYTKWSFDALNGKTADELKADLQRQEETFGAAQRRVMSDALQLARKWSMDILAKLGSLDDNTKLSIKRWFHTDAAGDEDIKKTAAVLLDGFKKISSTCNSTSVIFSDRPHKRANGASDSTFASVNSGDNMPVIYIFKLFLEEGKNAKGEVGKLWLCALTIIHELSHKLLQTKDLSYDDQGLKPGGVSLLAGDALKNADTWGYFAGDVVGALPAAKVKEVYQ